VDLLIVYQILTAKSAIAAVAAIAANRYSKGLSEYPLLSYWQIKGLAVDLVRR
jgi:hypothetical protein